MKKLYKILLVSISTLVLIGTTATAEESNATNENATSMGVEKGASEQYKLEVIAPLIDDNIFPVAVHYFDDLLSKGKRLKAVLLVPMKLTITNSRERRLLTIYTTNVNEDVAFGTSLKDIVQVKLSKKIKKASNLLTFVGPNKRVFRTATSGETYEINFTIPITQRNFHKSKVKVNIASTNGTQLTEICEVGASGCVETTSFTIVPRKVSYKATITDDSFYTTNSPKEMFSIVSSNVDIDVDENNKKLQVVSRKDLPLELEVAYKKQSFNPNLSISTKYKTFVNNMDFFPIIHYMSNNAYRKGDVIMFTNAAKRPDLTVRNADKATAILNAE